MRLGALTAVLSILFAAAFARGGATTITVHADRRGPTVSPMLYGSSSTRSTEDENALVPPTNVAPVEPTVHVGAGNQITYTFPPNSVTVLRVGAGWAN